MTASDDEIDALVRRLPAPPLSADARERVLAALRAEAVTRPGRFQRRRRLAVLAVVSAAAVGGAGTAAATLALERAHQRDVAHCYPTATTDLDDVAPGPDVAAVGEDTAAAAIELCAAEWRSGALTSTAPYTGSPGPVPYLVPPLVACVLPAGTVGVFAGPPGTCARLGLATSTG